MDHVAYLLQTNATILDDPALSAPQIADQLGHARPSLTLDVSHELRASARADAPVPCWLDGHMP
jgi:hypothetical protein